MGGVGGARMPFTAPLFVVVGLCCLFTVTSSAPAFESGILPHFKVDHVAGKLKISANRESADISYKNDNVDVTVKPNNKEQAKVVIDSMRDSEMGTKLAAAKKDESVRAAIRSINEKSLEGAENKPLVSNGQKVHMDASDDDIALRRNTIRKHEETQDDQGSDVTWRGRITHSTDEPDNNHVLSALNEIKSLMTLSMKPPNLKAFDQVLPLDSQDKYLNTPDVMKKLNHAAHKKRRTSPESRFSARKSTKHVVNTTPHNSTYTDDTGAEYGAGFTGKGQFVHRRAPPHKIATARKHASTARRPSHARKKCVRGHCRQEIFGGPDLGPNPDAPDGAFEELYLGKIKEHHDVHDQLPVEFRARDPDYDTLNELDEHEHAEHEPSHEDHEPSHYPKSHKGTDYVSPYHAQDHDDGYHTLYGDEDHHPSDHDLEHQDVNGFHGEGGSHHSEGHNNANNPDAAFEKQFEDKINDKDYNDDGHEVHHSTRHESHRPNRDEYVDEGDHFPHNSDTDVNDLGMFEHGDNMGETPSESHHLHNNYHEQLGNENENDNDSDNTDENDEAPSQPNNYDFDESKEIKDEEHDDPETVHMNGKLKDWYSANAIGNDNATSVMDEPVQHAAQGKDTHPSVDNKTTNDDKHIESKFENAGEKPLNSTAAEQAISKLNESLAKGLNDSTNNVISSSNSTAAAAAAASNATEKSTDTGNSTASLSSNATAETATAENATAENSTAENATAETTQPNENVENATETASNSTKETPSPDRELDQDVANSSANLFNLTHDTIQMKITNLEKKVNNSGDLLKQLEDIERKLNSTTTNKTTEALKKPLTETEKELLRVTPEDILQTHLPDSDDLGALHEANTNIARHLNSTTKEERKNVSLASKGEESEKAYSKIAASENKTSTHESGNHTDEGSAVAEDGSGAGLHLEKHGESAPASILVAVNVVHRRKQPHRRQSIQKYRKQASQQRNEQRWKKTNVKAVSYMSPDEMTMMDIEELMATPNIHDEGEPKRKLSERKNAPRYHRHVSPITDHTNDTNDILTGLNMNEVETRAQLNDYKDPAQIIDHIALSDDVLNQYKESTYQSEIEDIMNEPSHSLIHKKADTYSGMHRKRRNGCPCGRARKKRVGPDVLVELAKCLCLSVSKREHSSHSHRHYHTGKMVAEKHRDRRSKVNDPAKYDSLESNPHVNKADNLPCAQMQGSTKTGGFTPCKTEVDASTAQVHQTRTNEFTKSKQANDSSSLTAEEEVNRRKEISHSHHNHHHHQEEEKVRLKAKGVAYREPENSKKGNSKSKKLEETGHTRANQKERQYRNPPISLQAITQHVAKKLDFYNKPERPDMKSEDDNHDEDANKPLVGAPVQAQNDSEQAKPQKEVVEKNESSQKKEETGSKEEEEEEEEEEESQKGEDESHTQNEEEARKEEEDEYQKGEESKEEEERSQKEEVGKKPEGGKSEEEEDDDEEEKGGKQESKEYSYEKEEKERGQEGKKKEDEEETKERETPHRAIVQQPVKPITEQQLNDERQHLFSLFALAHKKKQEKIEKNLKKLQKDVKTDKDIQHFLAGEATDLEEEAHKLHSKWRPLHHMKSEHVDPAKAKMEGVKKVNDLLHRVHWWKKVEESQKEYHTRKSGQEVDALLQRHKAHKAHTPIDRDRPRLEKLREKIMDARKQRQNVLKIEKKLHAQLLMEARRLKEKQEMQRRMAEEKEKERVRQEEEKARDQWFHEHVMKKTLSNSSNGHNTVVSNASSSTRTSIFHYRSHRRGNNKEDIAAHRRTLDLTNSDVRAGIQALSNSSYPRQQLDNIILSVLPALSREIDISEHIIDRPFKDDMKYFAEQLDREEQNYVAESPDKASSPGVNNADKREHLLSASGQAENLAVENRYIVPLIKEVVRGINSMSRSELSALTKNRIGRFKDEREYNKFIEHQVKLLMEVGRRHLLMKKDYTMEPGKRYGKSNNIVEELSAERMNNITVMVEEEIYRLIKMKQKELQIFTDEDEKFERELNGVASEENTEGTLIKNEIKTQMNQTRDHQGNSTEQNDSMLEYVESNGNKDNASILNDNELAEFIEALPGKFNMTYHKRNASGTNLQSVNITRNSTRSSNNQTESSLSSSKEPQKATGSVLLFNSPTNKTYNFGKVSDNIGSLFLPKDQNVTSMTREALKKNSKFQILNATVARENDALLPTDPIPVDIPAHQVHNVEYTSKDEIHSAAGSNNITQYLSSFKKEPGDKNVTANTTTAWKDRESHANVSDNEPHYGNVSKMFENNQVNVSSNRTESAHGNMTNSDNLTDFKLPQNITVATTHNMVKDLKLPLEASTLNFTTKDIGNYILQSQSAKLRQSAKECNDVDDETCFAKVEIDISLIPKKKDKSKSENKAEIYNFPRPRLEDANLFTNLTTVNNTKNGTSQRFDLAEKVTLQNTTAVNNKTKVKTLRNTTAVNNETMVKTKDPQAKINIQNQKSGEKNTSTDNTHQGKVVHKNRKIIMYDQEKPGNSTLQNTTSDTPSKLSNLSKEEVEVADPTKAEFDLTIDDASKTEDKSNTSLTRRNKTKKMIKIYKNRDTMKNDVPEYLNSTSRTPDNKFLHRDIYMPHMDEGGNEGSGEDISSKDNYHTFFDKNLFTDEKYEMSRKQKKSEKRSRVEYLEKVSDEDDRGEVVLKRRKRDQTSSLEPMDRYNVSIDINLDNSTSPLSLPHNSTSSISPFNTILNEAERHNVTSKDVGKDKEVTVEVEVPLLRSAPLSNNSKDIKNEYYKGHPADIPNMKKNASFVLPSSNGSHNELKKKNKGRHGKHHQHKIRRRCNRRHTLCDVKPLKTSFRGHLNKKLLIKAIATPCGKDRVNVSAVIYSLCDRNAANEMTEDAPFQPTTKIMVNETSYPDLQEGVYVVQGDDLEHMLKKSSFSQAVPDSPTDQALDVANRDKRYDLLTILQKQLTASSTSNSSLFAKEDLKRSSSKSLHNSAGNSNSNSSVEDPVMKFTTYAKYIIRTLNDTINSSPTSETPVANETGKSDLLTAFFAADTNRTARSADKKDNDSPAAKTAAVPSTTVPESSASGPANKESNRKLNLADSKEDEVTNSSLVRFLNASLPETVGSNETEESVDNRGNTTTDSTREPLFNISSPLRLPSNSMENENSDLISNATTVITTMLSKQDNITLLDNEKYLKVLVRNLTLLANNYETLTLKEDSSAMAVFQQLKEKVNSIQEQIGFEGGRHPIVESEASKRNL